MRTRIQGNMTEKLPCERFLTDFQLLQQMGQQLAQSFVSYTARHYIQVFMSSLHYLCPRLVNVAKSFGFLQMKVTTTLWL